MDPDLDPSVDGEYDDAVLAVTYTVLTESAGASVHDLAELAFEHCDLFVLHHDLEKDKAYFTADDLPVFMSADNPWPDPDGAFTRVTHAALFAIRTSEDNPRTTAQVLQVAANLAQQHPTLVVYNDTQLIGQFQPGDEDLRFDPFEHLTAQSSTGEDIDLRDSAPTSSPTPLPAPSTPVAQLAPSPPRAALPAPAPTPAASPSSTAKSPFGEGDTAPASDRTRVALQDVTDADGTLFENAILTVDDRKQLVNLTKQQWRNVTIADWMFSLMPNPAMRAQMSDLEVVNATFEESAKIGGAIIRDSVFEQPSGNFKTNAAAFSHVRFRGAVGRLEFVPDAAYRDQAVIDAYRQANAAFYADVDWAIDLSETIFTEVPDLSAIPGTLVVRPHSLSALIFRDRLDMAEVDKIDFADTPWRAAIDKLVADGRDSEVLIAPLLHDRSDRFLDVIDALQESGIAASASEGLTPNSLYAMNQAKNGGPPPRGAAPGRAPGRGPLPAPPLPKPAAAAAASNSTDSAERADQFLETLRDMANIQIGYDRESILGLDDTIDRTWPKGFGSENSDALAILIGSYIGEVACRNLGLSWKYDEDRREDALKIGELLAYPISKAQKRITNGARESIANFYKQLETVAKDSDTARRVLDSKLQGK